MRALLFALLVACPGDPALPDDRDGDGYPRGADCDDGRPQTHPGGQERCDGVDNDCDGVIDEEAVDALPLFRDADGDGAGDPAIPAVGCPAAGWTPDATDCDDGRAEVHVGAIERCNGRDDDCDDQIDEDAEDAIATYADADGDGAGDPATRRADCAPDPSRCPRGGDCDDRDPAIGPAAIEVCDGIDNNCDGMVDDADPTCTGAPTWYRDDDADGYGDIVAIACLAPAGHVAKGGDCDDADPARSPGLVERCDAGRTDEDCDGLIDDADPSVIRAPTWYPDGDGDGYGVAPGASACQAPAGAAPISGDCDDADPATSPAAVEVCDGADDNCDGAVDEGLTLSLFVDADGDGLGGLATTGCAAGPGLSLLGGDCDDADPAVTTCPPAPDTADTADTADTGGASGSGAIRFLVVGDTGDGSPNQYAVADGMTLACALLGCDFVLFTGDNFYPGGVTTVSDPQWSSAFELPYANLSIPFYPVMGNHDWDQGSDTAYLDAQVGYTALSTKWTMPADYYTHTHGDATFFALDTHLADLGLSADQEAWLPGERAASTSTWNLAYAHHPYLSNGPHGDARGDLKGFLDGQVCGQFDVYFSGHDHNLQWLEDGGCGTALIVSGGGHSTYPLMGSNPVYFEDATLGFVWVEIDGNTLTAVFFDQDAVELYRDVIVK